MLQLEQLTGLIHPDDPHLVRTRLVCLENTHNRGAGRVQPYDVVESICDWAHSNGLATHLDGARLFNAVVASGIEAKQWGQHFDTVSICFSKGLGAPVGSALCGSEEMIKQARRVRKLFGGGMRQAGVIAAGRCTRWIITSSGWRKITRTPKRWPQPCAGSMASSWSATRSTRTW